MKKVDTKQLRALVSRFNRPDDRIALGLFTFDVIMLVALTCGVIFLQPVWLKLVCSIMAGMQISTLFVIGHDAAHNTYTSSRKLNEIIGRIAFLPALHNYGLWLRAHNRMHHQVNNVQGYNSWSPYSLEEYRSMSRWQQMRERFYRSVPGIAVYYMIERWWKEKFYPFSHIEGKYNSVYGDFALIVAGLAIYLSGLVYAGAVLSHTTVLELLVLGFVLPTMVWNFMIGFTVYQHHTHENISWARTLEERNRLGDQEDFTMHVQYPAWYNLLSHNIMEHTAHHVDPRIPCYRLAQAQTVIKRALGDQMHAIRFTIGGFLRTIHRCQLYDYDNHCWLDFAGNRTTGRLHQADVASDVTEVAVAA